MNWSLMPNEFFVAIAGIFGAAIGSFLHVCVWRIPHEQSVITPGSHCPACGQPIPWYDNIPLLSYIMLRGACRHCQARIPLRYPLYELMTALLFMGILNRFHLSPTAFLYLVVVCDLIIASGIDWDYQYIPDFLSLPMIPISILVAAVAQGTLWFPTALVQTVPAAVLGVLAGGGTIWLIRIVGSWFFRQEAMGFGDVKLMAFLGGFLGWPNSLLCIFLAAFLGSIVGVGFKLSGKLEKYGHIPFGPYLALGAYLCFLYGPEIIVWYTRPLIGLTNGEY